MKPTLVLQPIHNSSTDIMKSFIEGKPLSCDQLNFLTWHENELNSEAFDPLIKYYIESQKKRCKKASFLLPHEELNADDIKKLEERIRANLKNTYSHVAVEMNEKQYSQFKRHAMAELIYWNGQEFISGARFYVGGVMPAIYFQWAEFFCVWKYAMLHEEKRLRHTSMIYFEALRNRNLNQCVNEYKAHQQQETLYQQKLFFEKNTNTENIQKVQTSSETNTAQPRLIHSYHIDHLEK